MLSPHAISREWRLDLTGPASNSRSLAMLAAVRRPAARFWSSTSNVGP